MPTGDLWHDSGARKRASARGLSDAGVAALRDTADESRLGRSRAGDRSANARDLIEGLDNATKRVNRFQSAATPSGLRHAHAARLRIRAVRAAAANRQFASQCLRLLALARVPDSVAITRSISSTCRSISSPTQRPTIRATSASISAFWYSRAALTVKAAAMTNFRSRRTAERIPTVDVGPVLAWGAGRRWARRESERAFLARVFFAAAHVRAS